jgi:hypothetical protein
MGTKTKKEGRGKSFPSFDNHTTGNCVTQSYKYIPLDFIKTEVIGLNQEHFLSNNNLLFTPVLKDGDIIKYYYCEVDNIKIKIYPNSIFLSGSLHKFHNKGEHNCNDFDINAFRDVLRRFDELFKVRPQNLKLICLEYGVNITPPIESNQIINHLMQHKHKDFESKISNDKGNYKQAEHSEYIVKIYNKAKQFKLNFEVLRIEIKETNLRHHRAQGIYTLQDFIQSDKRPIVESLINKWDEVVYYDNTSNNQDRWNQYNNINFWRELSTQKSRTSYFRHRKSLRKLNESTGQNIQDKISHLIKVKIQELQRVTFSEFKSSSKFCKITGVDISMQRKDSFLLSHTGLMHLINNDIKEFERIKRKYLLPHWNNKPLKKQIKEIAHNIRNRFNLRTKSTNENQLTLFN